MDPSRESSNLGRCPNCEARIPSDQSRLTYEPTEGWPRMLAECGECGEVVPPV
ncbi:MAG: hypothetical protein V5A55_10185 [Halovenus sp.]